MAQPSQLIFPRLDLEILYSQVNPDTGNIQGKICRDDPTWKTDDNYTCKDYSIGGYTCSDVGKGQGGSQIAEEACPVACNTCPKDVRIKRDFTKMYRRLPSPVKDAPEPNYSMILKDPEWAQGSDVTDVSRDPYLTDIIEELEDKVDNLRKSIPGLKCLCSDIAGQDDKRDGQAAALAPIRCGNVSEQFEWDGIETWTDVQSKDTDVRYKVTCTDGNDYTQVNTALKDRQLVYNCTAQTWESRSTLQDDGGRTASFTPYDFDANGLIRCTATDPSTPKERVTVDIKGLVGSQNMADTDLDPSNNAPDNTGCYALSGASCLTGNYKDGRADYLDQACVATVVNAKKEVCQPCSYVTSGHGETRAANDTNNYGDCPLPDPQVDPGDQDQDPLDAFPVQNLSAQSSVGDWMMVLFMYMAFTGVALTISYIRETTQVFMVKAGSLLGVAPVLMWFLYSSSNSDETSTDKGQTKLRIAWVTTLIAALLIYLMLRRYKIESKEFSSFTKRSGTYIIGAAGVVPLVGLALTFFDYPLGTKDPPDPYVPAEDPVDDYMGPGASGPGASGPGASGPGASGPGASGPGASGPGASGSGIG